MGVFEEAKGKVKEVVGQITDEPDLEHEGIAQKDKGEAQREATKARAEAKAHDARARAKQLEEDAARAAK